MKRMSFAVNVKFDFREMRWNAETLLHEYQCIIFLNLRYVRGIHDHNY